MRLLVHATRIFLLRVCRQISICPMTSRELAHTDSSSCSVAWFFSFCGFGFLALSGAAISSCTIVSTCCWTSEIDRPTLLNQSESSGLLAKSSMSSCCIARAAMIALAFLTLPDGFSGSALDPHHVSSCFIRRGSGRLCSMYL
jgi:hypothetical protein